MKDNILITIITVCYNSEKTIKDTIESVLNQTYTNIEYILVDGNSTDNTVEIIKSYEKEAKQKGIIYKWISEPDKGIADAWNKGVEMSSGDIIGILNSDDWYENDSVEKAVECLNIEEAEISYGICKRFSEKKEFLETIDKIFNPKLKSLTFGFSHTTCFKTKKVYETIGKFDENFKIALDIDFLLRAYNNGIKFKKCKNITCMRLGGISTKYEKEARKEYKFALKKNGIGNFEIFISDMLKIVIKLKNYLKRG